MSESIDHLREILHRAEHVERIVGYGRRRIDEDYDVHEALIRHVEVIGEAAGQVDVSLRQGSSETVWRRARAMRNILIHAYSTIDDDIVWDTAVHHVPKLAELARKALTELEED